MKLWTSAYYDHFKKPPAIKEIGDKVSYVFTCLRCVEFLTTVVIADLNLVLLATPASRLPELDTTRARGTWLDMSVHATRSRQRSQRRWRPTHMVPATRRRS